MTQILHCGRTVAGGWVAFDIRWDDDLSGNRSVLWSMVVTSPEGAETVQLGYQLVDDGFSTQFVHDLATGRQHDVEQNADLGDREITVRFPAEVVGVAAHWPTWRGVINVDGSDVAEQVSTLAGG
jgi:hypothetical protein